MFLSSGPILEACIPHNFKKDKMIAVTCSRIVIHHACFNSMSKYLLTGLPCWLSWWRVCLQCRRPGFNPWVKRIPWRREWQSTPVFWPGESPGEKSLVGYSPWDHRVRYIRVTNTFTFFTFARYWFNHPSSALLLSLIKHEQVLQRQWTEVSDQGPQKRCLSEHAVTSEPEGNFCY